MSDQTGEIELSAFIQNALVQIAQGVRGANEKMKEGETPSHGSYFLRHNKGDSQKVTGVRFDVAVSASEESKGGAKLAVLFANIGLGGSTESTSSDRVVQRIQFEVGIDYDIK